MVKFMLIFLSDLAVPAYRLQGRGCCVLPKRHSVNPDRSVSQRVCSLDVPRAGKGASPPSAPSGFVLSLQLMPMMRRNFYEQGNRASGKFNNLAKAEQLNGGERRAEGPAGGGLSSQRAAPAHCPRPPAPQTG